MSLIDNHLLIARQKSPHNSIDRNPYLRDRGRIVHSAFFRRLQAKKQILDYYVNDFSRTRLTHSLEVAQISLGITDVLREKYPQKKIFPENFCIEAIALGHDLGHPPNGHAGEIALNNCMKTAQGFEGNAQTFRIISKLGEWEENAGLNLTRATMLGLTKYPIFYSQHKNSAIQPPKCIFDEEKNNFEWVFDPFRKDLSQIETLQNLVGKGKKNQKLLMNLFANIMDVADDIAYGVHDFEDGVTLELISLNNAQNYKNFKEIYQAATHQKKDISWNNFCEKIFSKSENNRKVMISKLVNFFIINCQLQKKEIFSHELLDYSVTLLEPIETLLMAFKKLVGTQIIKKRENQIIDFQLQNIIVKVFDCFKENTNLMPKKYQKKIEQEPQNKARFVCDYLAGMTDKYLVKIYKALFVPETSSIFDRL